MAVSVVATGSTGLPVFLQISTWGSNHPDSVVRQTIGAFDMKTGAELGIVDETMTPQPTGTASAISENHWQASGTRSLNPDNALIPR